MPSATANTELFDKLADLLVYPVEGYERRFDEALEALEAGGPGSAAGGPAEKLAPLAQLIGSVSLEDLEELYTRTFDINPSCTLEIGWQLYGEDYNRGSFLVRMRELMRELGVEESTELPDHLMHILPVLGRFEPSPRSTRCSRPLRTARTRTAGRSKPSGTSWWPCTAPVTSSRARPRCGRRPTTGCPGGTPFRRTST